MPATLINAFNVPADKEQEFLANWKKTTEIFSHKKGFVETKLHRNTGVGDQTFLFINIATWESTEAWDRVHGDYHPTEDDILGVKGHPACFEPVICVTYQGES